MKKICLLGIILPVVWAAPTSSGGGDLNEIKEVFQELQDFIGEWNGTGYPERDKKGLWNESVKWSWRFKGKSVWFDLTIPQGKYYKSGKLEYLLDDDEFRLTMREVKDKKAVFLGKLKNKRLYFERKDPTTKDTQKIIMNMAGGGIRFVYTFYEKPANRTLFYKRFQVAMTKKGETFGTAKKKIECIVTGGLGTIAVSYKGATYYVCCTGCRDAFLENPEQILKEYRAKKKKRR